MRSKTVSVLGALVGAAALIASVVSPAVSAGAGTIHVPSDFNPGLSDTRAHGHYEVLGSALRVWTDGNGDIGVDGRNSDKVAEYVNTSTPLASTGEPTLEYTPTSGTTPPGVQMIVDIDGNGSADGILVGEPAFYGNQWWASNPLNAAIGTQPAPGSQFGYQHMGPLSEWRVDFPNAQVLAFGFSLGSGVKGDGVISAINFAGTRYTFAKDVTLTSKDECKNGGWATSTMPVFKNQGECVSSFASGK